MSNSVPITVPSDSFEGAANYLINIELPGIAKKDVNIDIAENIISVKAEKKAPNKDYRKIDTGRLYGKIESRWSIPKDGDAEKISAALNEGLLTITIPKTKKREIKINLE
ncbi:Hsp20/alpha crystallin family protein [Trichomonas vaginalis G3]|uniref:Hsp20/alpha crystallin family protein n=1 Tax=Trichomonas vaginalis (strain ATCC PRA-98 / G3) TaxID=412133 RepID=A2FKF2_TRIV3|nr:HSP20-like chaperones family [Trichomonas vaginalis G3]EAX94618.1 Hsp20/alpha crystallin family protein [Trichomonas vaginalis G3]KAI5553732.1 HSP20-like chaperones family [Trichomonas vaginalis G3]|eukprot:XP_001307548.1 Hsp20/alpha crystallin family protein [Trichomonas vaginalis G3]